MMERKLMERGKLYSDTFESAVQANQLQRAKKESVARSHYKIVHRLLHILHVENDESNTNK